ncbi:MarR family winged helix-turn-helix transcriptional regulator [Clostridium taeniosporum]|uniref:MarR family transcriptional regulator n=1 Tax=Clostridium taeniosporum TaxID=394958 RepID=A0A1D7XLY6_9CLOT|nr:MarR family transcriptional regulator [Clostridium taeniosporum]AOR24358.1 MarR family transcriptional regulator [Clostridium taeniosporum]
MKNKDTLEILNELMELSSFMKKLIIRPTETNSEINISRLQMQTLSVLYKFNSINMTNLAKQLMVTKQQATGIVNNLVKKGYVSRAVNPENRKEILLNNTESGEEMIKMVRSHMTDRLYKYFDILSPEDKIKVLEASKAINEVVKKIEPKPLT